MLPPRKSDVSVSKSPKTASQTLSNVAPVSKVTPIYGNVSVLWLDGGRSLGERSTRQGGVIPPPVLWLDGGRSLGKRSTPVDAAPMAALPSLSDQLGLNQYSRIASRPSRVSLPPLPCARLAAVSEAPLSSFLSSSRE